MRIRTITHSLLSAAVLFSFAACGDSEAKGDDQFLAYPHRTCTSGGKGLKSGGKIKGGDIAGGEESFCDGQFKQGGGRVAFRVFPNSRMTYERREGNLYLRLVKGRMLIDAEKRRAGGRIYLQSGGSMVRMLGTKVFMTKESESKLRVELLEGKVQVRSAPYLRLKSFAHGLPAAAEKSAAKAMPELFKSKVVVLEPGTSVQVSESGDPLTSSSEFKNKLDRAFAAKKIQAAAQGDPAAFGELAAKAGKQAMAGKTEALEKMKKNTMRVTKTLISGKRRWLHARWSRNLGHIPAGATSAGRLKVLLERRYGKKKSDSILKDLRKKAPPGILYKIFLKDGRTFQGRAEQEGGRYRLVTSKGDIMIAKDQVDKIEILVPGK